MVLLLRHHLSLPRWLALFLLFLGISLVQIENMTSTKAKLDVNPGLGLVAVIGACKSEDTAHLHVTVNRVSGSLSGLAGVYFEMILKGSNVSIWIRNIQLGAFSIVFASMTMFLSDGHDVRQKGFLYGYTPLVWTAIFTQSAGGLLVAVVIKYADNILKCFATSSAIIISCVISVLLFDSQLTGLFVLGALLVICAIFLYLVPDLFFQIPLLNRILTDRSALS